MKVEGVACEAETERLVLLCFVCARATATAFALGAAEIPPRSGHVSGIAVCPACMGGMTKSGLREWDEDLAHEGSTTL